MDNEKMGAFIAGRRKALQLTQAELASRLHVTRQAVSKWESGRSVPDTGTLLAMAELFGVPVETILSGEDAVPPAAPAQAQAGEPDGTAAERCIFLPPPAVQVYRQGHPVFRQKLGWLFFLPALVLALLVVLIPLGRTAYYSMTNFNMLESPHFVGMQNYAAVLGDPLTMHAVMNTLWILVIAGGIPLLLGWLFGSAAARLPLPVGVIIGVLFGAGSLSALTPSWLALLFSGDVTGLLNNLLLMRGIVTEPIPWLTVHGNAVQCLQLGLLCLAPAYLIFHIGGRCGRMRAAWHVGVTAVPALLLANWMASASLVGYPSFEYRANWLPAMIFDYGSVRFEAGVACALILICLLLMAVVVTAGHLLVWAGACLLRLCRPEAPSCRRARAAHWCGGIAGLVCGVLLLFPAYILINYAVKPAEELFLFPPVLLTSRPVGENFTALFSSMAVRLSFARIPLYLLYALAVYLLTALPAAIGAAFLPERGKRIAVSGWLIGMATAPLLGYGSLWNFSSFMDAVLPVSLLRCMTSPLLPLSMLLTVWILRQSTAGCRDFADWRRKTKRVVLTGAAVLAVGLGTALSLLYIGADPMLYSSDVQFPLGILQVSGMRIGVLSAGHLLLYAAGIVLVTALVMTLLADRMGRRPVETAPVSG